MIIYFKLPQRVEPEQLEFVIVIISFTNRWKTAYKSPVHRVGAGVVP